MAEKLSAAKVGLVNFVICAVACGLVVLFEPDVLNEPWRWGILILIVVGVPLANYLLARRRQSRDGG